MKGAHGAGCTRGSCEPTAQKQVPLLVLRCGDRSDGSGLGEAVSREYPRPAHCLSGMGRESGRPQRKRQALPHHHVRGGGGGGGWKEGNRKDRGVVTLQRPVSWGETKSGRNLAGKPESVRESMLFPVARYSADRRGTREELWKAGQMRQGRNVIPVALQAPREAEEEVACSWLPLPHHAFEHALKFAGGT